MDDKEQVKIINLTILECKMLYLLLTSPTIPHNKSNHIGM